ncbi:putative lactose facilitator 1 [Scheffersomyces amazonensis]|uniref:putative lactose facilitator 1 n=1 Tax=Scheffersomyces amazonensis TaxID=1078765 RepID=UPI00315DD34F
MSLHSDISPTKEDKIDPQVEELEDNIPNTWEGIDVFPIFSRPMIPLLASCGLVYFLSASTGYDTSLMSSIYTQPSYFMFFKLDPESSTSTGIVFSIINIGQVVAALFCPLIDYYGRKKIIHWGSLGIIIGCIITIVSQNKETLIAGRFFMAFFTVLSASAGSLYLTEITPPHARARIAGCAGTLYYIGAILSALVAYGAFKHNSPYSERTFRIPFGVQCVFPGIVFVFGWWLPESPRWLVGVGKVEEAKQIIAKYHCNGNADHPLLHFEIAEIQASFADESLESPVKLLDIRPVLTKGNLYRTFLVIAIAWFGQFSGNNCNSYYLPTMLSKIGWTSLDKIVLMNAVYALVSWVAAVCGAYFHEKVGRRKMFMFSTMACALCLTGLAVATARYIKTGAAAASKTALGFIIMFGMGYGFGITPMQMIYPAEVSSNVLRSRSFIIWNIAAGAAQFVNQFATPTAMANISFWFYVFYALWDVFEFFVIYFTFVETKGKTLEEMEEIFAANSPKRVSLGDYSKETDESRQAMLQVTQVIAQSKIEEKA